MSPSSVEPDIALAQLPETVTSVAPLDQQNINRLKLAEAPLDNLNVTDCAPEPAQQPDVCVHDTDNCNQTARKTVHTPQMG